MQLKAQRWQAVNSSSTSSRATPNTSEEEKEARIKEFQALIRDLVHIISSTGFETGLKRSFSVARATATLTREMTKDFGAFLTNDGRSLNLPLLLRRLFEELGATYIKLGQFIASSPTLFPPEYVLEFQACLDNSPVIPYSEIEKIIASELGSSQSLSSVFSYIDRKPLASASIAQVHRATMLDGREAVIKVRKPHTEETLKADLGFLLITSKLLEFINPALSRLSLASIVGDIRASMLDELDFTKEEQNLRGFRAFLERQGRVTGACAPEPYISTQRVLVMEYLKGVPLLDLEGIKQYTKDPEGTLITALQTWAASVVDNDTFHADLHGGNLLMLENGMVGFIDFGIVGSIPSQTWNALEGLINSLAMSDFKGVAASLVAIGATDDRIQVDVDRFGRELAAVSRKIINSVPDPAAAVGTGGVEGATDNETTQTLLEIVRVAEDNGIKLPREFGILIKQALYFDRYQRVLAPELDPLRDDRVRASLRSMEGEREGSHYPADGGEGEGEGDDAIIDVEIVGEGF
jgi:aarF domain-containing kinase